MVLIITIAYAIYVSQNVYCATCAMAFKLLSSSYIIDYV